LGLSVRVWLRLRVRIGILGRKLALVRPRGPGGLVRVLVGPLGRVRLRLGGRDGVVPPVFGRHKKIFLRVDG
jgi:hypothetical protein